jgi:hypothetical protein
MALTLEIAKDIWSSEDGYRRINYFFCKNSDKNTYKQGLFIRGNKELIDFYDDKGFKIVFEIKNVIDVLKEGMKPANSEQIYYRGENVPRQSFKKEGFMSFTEEIDIAIPFMENSCCLFEAILDSDVKRLKMGGEREILIENGCYWEHTGRKTQRNVYGDDYDVLIVKIHSPKSSFSYPTYGSCIIPTKNETTQEHSSPQHKFEEMTEEEWEELNGGGKIKTKKNKIVTSRRSQRGKVKIIYTRNRRTKRKNSRMKRK